MGFFTPSDRVSRKEFKKALYKLRTHGFSHDEIDQIENVFRGDLHESGSSQGISKEEIKKGISWLKDHSGNHHLSSEQLDKLESALRHYL
ncbi:MAG: hypothetical protein Q7S86_04010 [bacterium]|nr:hypothetical protein [bacterium]